MAEVSLHEPGHSTDTWWKGTDDRWYPPFDGKRYAIPQWHIPVVRPLGLPTGKVRNPWAVAALSVITLGIYLIYWQYMAFRDLKNFTWEGMGAPVGLVFAIILPIINGFVLPSEVGRIYRAENKLEPVTGLTGFWIFVPVLGILVWAMLNQSAMNRVWTSYDATVQVPTS